jgi:hypothetical protein
MATPTRGSSFRSSNNSGPSGPILRQLLDDINGTTTPVTRRNKFSTPSSLPSSRGTRSVGGSVWVGGTGVAQDAREKLRAADEARLKKTSSREDRGTLHSFPAATVLTFQSHTTPSSPVVMHEGGHGQPTSSVTPPRQRPTLSSLQIPSSRFITQPGMFDDDIARANSPLMFVDSDISSTPSPSEPPTSAVTISSSDATSMPSPSTSWGSNKRSRSPESTPRTITKKIRTMTMPDTWDLADAHVVRDTAFIERAAINPSATRERLLELSSFRPNAVASTGIPEPPPRPKTPTRSPTSSPEPPETPSYARPLHLTDSSIVFA